MAESPLLKGYIDNSHHQATHCNTERQHGDGPKPVVQTYQVLGLQTQ